MDSDPGDTTTFEPESAESAAIPPTWDDLDDELLASDEEEVLEVVDAPEEEVVSLEEILFQYKAAILDLNDRVTALEEKATPSVLLPFGAARRGRTTGH